MFRVFDLDVAARKVFSKHQNEHEFDEVDGLKRERAEIKP
jgi:hypothetical protein